MDIDEFLDRELSDLTTPSDASQQKSSGADVQEFKEQDALPLLDSIKGNLSQGNLGQAEQSYVQLWHVLVQQKLKWDKNLYDQITALSRQFSSALNSSYAELKTKSDHINELVSRGRAALKEGKKEMPFKLYAEIQEINNSISSIFFEEKRIIEQQITDYYKVLKNTTDAELVKRVYSLVQEINQLIGKTNASIRVNDMTNAIVNYNKCIELYNNVPEGFLRRKNSAGMRLLEIYRALSIFAEISNLQKQLGNGQLMLSRPSNLQSPQAIPALKQRAMQKMPEKIIQEPHSSNQEQIDGKREQAKKNLAKGFYKEAKKNIQEALKLDPNDVEAKALQAKIVTLQ